MLGGQPDIFSTIIWFFLLFVFIFLYPRLMLMQMVRSLEQSAVKYENLSKSINKKIKNKIDAGSKDLGKVVDKFTDFFVITPSSLDPYGLVKKVDQTVRQMEWRFTEFVEKNAASKTKEEQQYINYSLRAAMGVRQISKIVRHYVELVKKFKNLQIAMILKMQMPLIDEIIKGEAKGADAFMKGMPVGDSIGPLVTASLMDKSKTIAEDVVMGEAKINQRKAFLLKATGPTPHLGRVDEAIAKIMKKNKIKRVVIIDAAAKLEGEKTGTVSEGVGFAMGGLGQRELIENYLLPKKMPMDSVVVKVGLTEAIEPMKKEIFDAVDEVKTYIEKAVERVPKNSKVIVIGVGNSCGIGDNKKTVENVKKFIEKTSKQEEKKKK